MDVDTVVLPPPQGISQVSTFGNPPGPLRKQRNENAKQAGELCAEKKMSSVNLCSLISQHTLPDTARTGDGVVTRQKEIALPVKPGEVVTCISGSTGKLG